MPETFIVKRAGVGLQYSGKDGQFGLRCTALGEAELARESVTCRGTETGIYTISRKSTDGTVDEAIWTLSADDVILTRETWTFAPDGSRLMDTDRFRRMSGTGLVGRWRKFHSTEAPTVYDLSITGNIIHVIASGGQLDFKASLILGPSRGCDTEHANGNIYIVRGSHRLLETSCRAGRKVEYSAIGGKLQ